MRNANLYQYDIYNHIFTSKLDLKIMGIPRTYADRPYFYRISKEQLSMEFYPNYYKFSESISYGFEFSRGCRL